MKRTCKLCLWGFRRPHPVHLFICLDLICILYNKTLIIRGCVYPRRSYMYKNWKMQLIRNALSLPCPCENILKGLMGFTAADCYKAIQVPGGLIAHRSEAPLASLSSGKQKWHPDFQRFTTSMLHTLLGWEYTTAWQTLSTHAESAAVTESEVQQSQPAHLNNMWSKTLF